MTLYLKIHLCYMYVGYFPSSDSSNIKSNFQIVTGLKELILKYILYKIFFLPFIDSFIFHTIFPPPSFYLSVQSINKVKESLLQILNSHILLWAAE